MASGYPDVVERRGAASTQARAHDYGDYGRQINEILMASPNPLITFAECQAIAATERNLQPPAGYEAIKDAVCYIAVFETAWQAGYIDAAQLAFLRIRSNWERGLSTYYLSQAQAREDAVKGYFKYVADPRLYWFFGRSQTGKANLFRQAYHLMFALDGVNAAGSNNSLQPGVPNIQFATHDLNKVGPTWDKTDQVWVIGGDYFEIIATPLDILRNASLGPSA